MKFVATVAAFLLGFVDWVLFIVAGVGSFFLARQGGFDPDGAFFAALLAGVAAMLATWARIPGRSRSFKDVCLIVLARIFAHAGWDDTQPPTVLRAYNNEPPPVTPRVFDP
jgi:hypothetical protein